MQNRTVKCEQLIRELLNVTKKELLNVMFEVHNMRMKPSNVRKKVRESPNVRKKLSHVILELHNVRIESSNVRKKSKRTTKCEKRTVTCDVRTTQCEDETVKCEKKSKGTTTCEKRTVTCDVGIAQCNDGIVKCEKKITQYSRLTTSGYRSPFFLEGTVELPKILMRSRMFQGCRILGS